MDLTVACLLVMMVIRWNYAVRQDLFPEFQKEVMEDPFVTIVGLFAMLYFTTGKQPLQALVGLLIVGAIVYTKNIWLFRAVALLTLVLLIIDFKNGNLKNPTNVGQMASVRHTNHHAKFKG